MIHDAAQNKGNERACVDPILTKHSQIEDLPICQHQFQFIVRASHDLRLD